MRERVAVLSGVAILTGISWAYMFYLARGMEQMNMPMCTTTVSEWGPVDYFTLFAMWAVMMVAMMAPSVAPMLLVFSSVNRHRREKLQSYSSTGVFLAGYIAAWTGFSAAATVVQTALHATALLSPMMVSNSALLGGSLLLAAGVFQWTPLKYACLNHCRTPLGFILNEWRDGARGAFTMGLRHGSYCIGCCWLLMALLFVAGVMNLLWIAAIAVFVLLEKIVPRGAWVARAAGVLMIAWGGWMIAGVLR